MCSDRGVMSRKPRPAAKLAWLSNKVTMPLVQSRRDKRAAKRLLRKLLKRQCRAPRVMITDKLPSYGAAKREVMPAVEHRQHKGLNNRAENLYGAFLVKCFPFASPAFRLQP